MLTAAVKVAVVVLVALAMLLAGVHPLAVQAAALALALVPLPCFRGSAPTEGFEEAQGDKSVVVRLAADGPPDALRDKTSFPAKPTAFTSESKNLHGDAVSLTSRIQGPPSKDVPMFGDFTIVATVDTLDANPVSLFRLTGMAAGGETTAPIDLSLATNPAADERQLGLTVGDSVLHAPVSPSPGPMTVYASRRGNHVRMGYQVHSLQSELEQGHTEHSLPEGVVLVPGALTPARINADSVVTTARLRLLLCHSRALSQVELAELMRDQRHDALMKDPQVAKLSQERDDAEKRLLDLKTKNPYGADAVAEACADVTDWTPADAVAHASAKCKAAIADFCAASPTAPGCACWQDKNAGEAACVNLRMMMAGKKPPDLDKLDGSSLQSVKDKYNLVDKSQCKPIDPPPPAPEEGCPAPAPPPESCQRPSEPAACPAAEQPKPPACPAEEPKPPEAPKCAPRREEPLRPPPPPSRREPVHRPRLRTPPPRERTWFEYFFPFLRPAEPAHMALRRRQ